MLPPDPPLLPDDTPENDLDGLIRDALASSPDAERLERLESFWLSESRSEPAPAPAPRWPVRWALGLAVAASLLLMVGWSVWRHGGALPEQPQATVAREKPSQDSPAPDGPPPPSINGEAPAISGGGVADEFVSPDSQGRAPTAYERLMFAARTQTRLPSPEPDPQKMLDRAIARFKAAPTKDLDALAAGLSRVDRSRLEALLLEKARQSRGVERVGAVRLLAVFGSQQALPGLLGLCRSDAVRDEALAAIEAIAGVESWAAIARQAPDPTTRGAIARRLLADDTEAGLLAFLSLVQDESLRGDALAAAARLRDLPVQRLVAMLDHADEPVRLAAATALGRLNRCEAADRFLADASRNPRMLGQLNNARLLMSRGAW